MSQDELIAALAALYREWEYSTAFAFNPMSGQSLGRRTGTLHAAARKHTPRLVEIERQINQWAGRQAVSDEDEYRMRYRAGAVRCAVTGTNPNDPDIREFARSMLTEVIPVPA